MGGNDFSKDNSSELKEDLRSLERYIEELSLFLPLPIFSINPRGGIVDINQAAQKLSGYTETETIDKDISFLFKDKIKAKRIFEQVLKKESIKDEELILAASKKKEIPVSISGTVRKNSEGEIIGVFWAVSDITEIKKFQKELEKKVEERTKKVEEKAGELEESRKALMNILEDVEEEKNKTSAIIQNFTDGLLFFNEENKLFLVNPRAKDFLGAGEDVIGKSILELSELKYSSSFGMLLKLLGEEKKKVYREELVLKENLILEASAIPVLMAKEKLGTLVILHDITREKTVEKLKTEFVSLAAHQLRTPLSAIKWTLKMLLDGDLGEITKEQKNFIEKTYTTNERVIELINDLLNVTRIEEGKYLYKPIPADLEEICQLALSFYGEEIKKKAIEFEFKKSKNKLPQVIVDIEKIKIAFQNFINNAIRYTPVGGRVTVSLKHDKKEITVQIKDTGIGIPADQKERIFTKFFRGTNAMKLETEGSGLGLYIAKNIIEAHGGKIGFESEKDKGTTFYFTLPTKEESTESLTNP